MKSNKQRGAGLELVEKKETGDNYALLDAIEGTEECFSCQRFMRLGEGKLCLTVKDNDLNIAEIVGFISGRCAHYLEAVSPFDTEAFSDSNNCFSNKN